MYKGFIVIILHVYALIGAEMFQSSTRVNCIAGKFSNLLVHLYNRQIKIHQHFLLVYARVGIIGGLVQNHHTCTMSMEDSVPNHQI